MAKKQFFLIIDTETTQTNMVADFGAVIIDRKGEIHNSAAILVRDFFLDREAHPLFHSKDADPLWGAANLPKRYANYDAMLSDGRRTLGSVNAINRWLAKALGKYNPTLTAYNLAFDRDKMRKSGIDCDMFDKSFCLWYAAANQWATSKEYRQFILNNHCFNTPTAYGNMSYHTNAEVMAAFIQGHTSLEEEPHTAFEDARDFEAPILAALLKRKKASELLEEPPAYNWRNYQVRDWFVPK